MVGQSTDLEVVHLSWTQILAMLLVVALVVFACLGIAKLVGWI